MITAIISACWKAGTAPPSLALPRGRAYPFSLAASCVLLLSASCASDRRVEPRVFAPAVISTQGYESHAALSPRGDRLLFVKSSPAFDGWQIWEAQRSGRMWTHLQKASFSNKGVSADPFFAPDGWVYFISTRTDELKTGKDLDIWRVRPEPGKWGEPERLPEPINSAGAEWFPRLLRDGTLYFGSDRPGGVGATDIYRAVKTRAGWRVENLGAPVNSAADEYEFEVSEGGSLAILMAARPDSAAGDLYLVRNEGGAWGPPARLGPTINGPGLEVGPYIRGSRLFYSSVRSKESLGDIYEVSMSRIVSSHAN